ncbi:eukaryotic aspartyl protease (macronuclear) [Tetrahymena thermophila SB210]|uniref:Eukaryotic aspartyl protease n=1 Tax=Tetrahymena thermophila (strain SB210) TaxID=312017 RepID=Q22LM2_TETTS|nr:eukaryotic aspartyl protease [Tetrahymena thermophila SB210]EAR86244.1 eukaryotic aspartyl protease [Tetrahymena thermophila SB210]|eukprot:XP_976839.1 eukaryotic aspartyl protease [Tetrahymena thermophila SB210]
MNKNIYLAIFAILLSCVICQSNTISLPLKISEQNSLIINTKYGDNQCEVNLIPLDDYCSNVITQTDNELKACGVKLIGENKFIGGKQYVAKFQLGDVQADLKFTNPDSQSSFEGEKALCFSKKDSKTQDNVIDELFKQGLIKQKRFYVNVDSIDTTKGVIGSIDIGTPNLSLIKKGSKLVNLKHYDQNDDFSTPSDSSLRYGDLQFIFGSVAGFDLLNPYISIGITQLNAILKQIRNDGVKYEYYDDDANIENYVFNVDSIEKLKDISFNVIADGDKPFKIIIKPQHYTRKLKNGNYQVLIYPQAYTDYIGLGYSVLQAYYLGYDIPSQSYIIAEKAESNVNQF